MGHRTSRILWLRDYFTDAEIEYYKNDLLAKYFSKKNDHGFFKTDFTRANSEGKAQKLSREGKRQRNSAVKSRAEKKRQGNGKTQK